MPYPHFDLCIKSWILDKSFQISCIDKVTANDIWTLEIYQYCWNNYLSLYMQFILVLSSIELEYCSVPLLATPPLTYIYISPRGFHIRNPGSWWIKLVPTISKAIKDSIHSSIILTNRTSPKCEWGLLYTVSCRIWMSSWLWWHGKR